MEIPVAQDPDPVPANSVKIDVKFYLDDATELVQLKTFDRSCPLLTFITDLCTSWSLDNPSDWALKFSEGSTAYVTEKNRVDIKNGSVLLLCPSAGKNAVSIVDAITMGDSGMKQDALKQLSVHASDLSFVQEFINNQGMMLLINIIEEGGWEKSPATASLGEVLPTTLGCFLELMDHGIVSWNVVDQTFITKISSYVNRSECDPTVVMNSLTILELLLLNNSKQALVEKEISYLPLVQHLKQSVTQANTLSYINAIFTKSANAAAREKLSLEILTQEFRGTILNDVIPVTGKISRDVARQVYILQCHLMQVIHQRHQNSQLDSEATEKRIAEIKKRTAAVLAEVTNLGFKIKGKSSDAMHRLGFKNLKSPLDDFVYVPNPLLVLDCIHYFTMVKTELFRQWLLESLSRKSSECPFFTSSVEIVQIFAELFCIGQPPADQGGIYDSVIFSSDYPFEEAYCLAMRTLNKTWKEMKATSQDFPKVMGVLKEQIVASLRDTIPPATIEIWRNRIKEFDYARIIKIQNERLTDQVERIRKLCSYDHHLSLEPILERRKTTSKEWFENFEPILESETMRKEWLENKPVRKRNDKRIEQERDHTAAHKVQSQGYFANFAVNAAYVSSNALADATADFRETVEEATAKFENTVKEGVTINHELGPATLSAVKLLAYSIIFVCILLFLNPIYLLFAIVGIYFYTSDGKT